MEQLLFWVKCQMLKIQHFIDEFFIYTFLFGNRGYQVVEIILGGIC